MTQGNDKFSFVTDARYLVFLILSIKILKAFSVTGSIDHFENERFFGIDATPHLDGGVLLSARRRFSCVIVRDPNGSITEPANMIFPKGFLKACRRKKFHTMVTENQKTYEAEDSVPAFIQPRMVHVFYCGAYVAGKVAPTEDNAGSVLYLVRASIDNGADTWAVRIKLNDAKISELWNVMTSAPVQKGDSIVVSSALGLLSDTMQAHAREFYNNPKPIWFLEEIKTTPASAAYRAQYQGAAEIVACIAQANPLALEGGGNG
ncbi:hypothetical protein [Acetobacter sp. AAB5]|uniref:hypothetical protein n=1 Tax=Acetobacter sp. AAB5 TaxID=3418370 RepID=UPI003CEAF897